jgi:DNA (cytosine-5)-methyltransferase 1
MDLGFRKAGFTAILALDSSQAAVETYNWNARSEVARKCELSKLTGDDLVRMVREVCRAQPPRGVIAGPPCQSFSRGNTQKKRSDPRARLGLAYAQLVRTLNEEFGLDFMLFENVVELRTERHSHRFQIIQRELSGRALISLCASSKRVSLESLNTAAVY